MPLNKERKLNLIWGHNDLVNFLNAYIKKSSNLNYFKMFLLNKTLL